MTDSKTLFLVVCATVAFSVASSRAEEATGRPNILLLLADDLGWSDLGCYGSEIHTPNLDALAANGLRFTQFYNCARCCPARASLLTGLYPHQAGMGLMAGGPKPGPLGYEGRLTDRCVTIPEVLKTGGYRCYAVGKWHLNSATGPIARGFDEFYGMLGGFNSCWQEKPFFSRLPADRTPRAYTPGTFYSTDVFADYALDFLADGRASRKPWFLYLAFNAPHFPLHAPEKDIARYEPIYQHGWDKIRAQRLARQQAMGLVSRDLQLPPRSHVPANFVNRQTGWADQDNPAWDSLEVDRRADLARRMAVYAAMIDRMDAAIGRVVTDLKQHGELENTLILFLSDNGACAEWDPYGFDGQSGPKNVLHKGAELKKVGGPESYISYGSGWANACNTPWKLYKHYGHEGGISTPLIVHWPAHIKAKGDWRTHLGHVMDFLPTFAEITGCQYPERRNDRLILPVEGISLVPALENKTLARNFLAWEHEGNAALRAGDWKLVRIGATGRWQLFDFRTDRTELHDLADKHPERVNSMAAQWEAWAERTYARSK
jgi:arylsulfatase A-like enzyme